MRSRILISLTALLLLGTACSDPCKDNYCLNGGQCVEGECLCPEGFSGPHCEYEDPCHDVRCLNGGRCDDGRCICPVGYGGLSCEQALTPAGVRITKVKVTQFPARNQNGYLWDQTESAEPTSWLPELYVRIYKENDELGLSNYVPNCDPSDDYTLTVQPPVIFRPLTAKCIVRLYDFDHQQNADDLIGGYYFYFSNYTGSYPSKITLYNSSTWHEARMEVYVEWLF